MAEKSFAVGEPRPGIAEPITSIPLQETNSRLLLLTGALPLVVLATSWFVTPGWSYVATTGALALFLLVLGQSISGTPFGVLINERNLMSLSRVQAAIWTVVVMGGYLTMAISRVKAGTTDAVDVGIPQELWLAMGISTTSLLGTPLILGAKRSRKPDEKMMQNTSTLLNERMDEMNQTSQGTLYANKSLQEARVSDIFQGDEVGNTAHVDLAKVQMFYFTLIAAVSYFMDVAGAVMAGKTGGLPPLSQGFVALLAISHGGYLLGKANDHSNSRPA
ncbi:hypothetical protein JY651_01545 [Pyxidicoccus parkwayensis]|uniref:Uncharacterized protein n=1 Tax=Pyxidicoccus parkwayensis TaxID=2813578 RepID=A0ABX7NXP5_9BACT|nr:hypothetical protein [Pyxidicoccus parkwaysis]QSQ23696.1 hypothetical protein JY651_01545 [Pyxidicoccus parkwaysis]